METGNNVYTYYGSLLAEFNYNFEIRVGNDGTEIGNNPICYKQFEVMTFGVVNFSCSQNVFGAWVSINKSPTDVFTECLVIQEVRIYGSKSK